METQCSTLCALNPGALRIRLAEIADLNRTALRGSQRDERRLTLRYDPASRPAVMEMISREEICCGFLRFMVGDAPGGLIVVIEAPDEALL
jgi:hypothetical protein